MAISTPLGFHGRYCSIRLVQLWRKELTDAPSPWSTINPKLQVVWDATSLNSLQFCPRRYQYEIIEGYRSSGIDLEFGAFFASAVERFKKARLAEASKDTATIIAIRYALEASWPEEDAQPWGGSYSDQWRCTGSEPYKNKKGNRAKCPWAHKGMWFPAPAPTFCGECGSPTEHCNRWNPAHKAKDRYGLMRLVSWWCEEQPEDLRDGFAAITINGVPAVELSVKMPLPFATMGGEPYLLAGHFDDISAMGEENFINDNKTTTKPLNPRYWGGYAPNTQVDTYDLMGSTLFADLSIQGVVIDAAQVLPDGARFGRHILHRTEPQREEWLKELRFWLSQAERFAEEEYWPMNRSHCFLCPFNGVCSKQPNKRLALLEEGFVKRHWNPLAER